MVNVNSFLFRWEDTPALKHHCGFCDRPLSHPGARVSCFGPHAEPCHRFHQAMFMRGRAHVCHYCHTIDEAHYMRHHKIAEQLHGIYESCGEDDRNIVPSESADYKRGRENDTRSADSKESDRSLTPDLLSSKRDRKDAKRLVRAASRSRVITQEEIRYVDSVLHSSEGVSGNEIDGPRNADEIDEIEKHLRFNAHVYHNSNRRELKMFAQLPNADVDFDAEMDRILDAFHISDFEKRNVRTRGLQGKELKTFQKLVFEFKKAVVDDLVLIKKDLLEVRMRRAGYLRYTNRTAYEIVENRYSDKDWKTGERIRQSTSSDSSGVTTPDESPAEKYVSISSELQENSPPRLRSLTHNPDRRHLEKIYRRVDGNDEVHTAIIESYQAPLLPISPVLTPRKHAVQPRLVVNQTSEVDVRKPKHQSPHKALNVQQDNSFWATVTRSVWGGKPPQQTLSIHQTAFATHSIDILTEKHPGLPRSKSTTRGPSKASAPAVQAAFAGTPDFLNEPEGFGSLFNEFVSHPAISQKKVKKDQRETRRKTRKIVLQKDADFEKTSDDINGVSSSGFSLTHGECEDAILTERSITADLLTLAHKNIVHSHNINANAEIENGPGHLAPSMPPATAPMLVTHHGRHANWTRFMRYLVFDNLTSPCLQASSGCIQGTTCRYESNDILDCPYHKPHCACVDPLSDRCYLVYPGSSTSMCSSGPYNYLHGKELLSIYERDPIFKDRVMLVDDDMAIRLMTDPPNHDLRTSSGIIDRLAGIPHRLVLEYAEFQNGYNPGPLMKQERMFERMRQKNKSMKHQITRKMLLNVQRRNVNREGIAYMCYCHAEVHGCLAKKKDIVVCSHRDCDIGYFHKSCVKKLGVEKVSRWYCTRCEHRMGIAARQLLRDLGCTDIPDEADDEIDMDANVLKQLLDVPAWAMSRFQSIVRALDAPETGLDMCGIEAEDTD